ncbi:MAG: long-chain fatty acid--CoA ligase, partial [Chlorobiaceae bacterium]|nr:long-chain fatty acid--CoA ligase [Chlorobiaceae bacterium]
MALLKEFKTIPELYEFLTEEFGKNNPERFVMKQKVEKEWVGIKYAEFKEQTETFALGLASLGVKRGDNVSIISENRPEWVYCDMA